MDVPSSRTRPGPSWFRIGVLFSIPVGTTLVVGHVNESLHSGLVVGAGVGFGFALSVLLFRTLHRSIRS